MKYDVVVIGGGPAGMAAALAAKEKGSSVIILERDVKLGGILNQCIHNGFGLHYFKEELCGPEYANRFVEKVNATDIKVLLETMVLSITPEHEITAVSPTEGVIKLQAGSIILAMGCRERAAGAIALPGSRPAGIYSAGMAQRMMNIEGYRVGKKVVILGSGDIGLIMARRMTFEGAKVQMVLELMPYSSGLKRNIVQCLDDFDIPMHFAHTITRVVGKERLEGLYYAEVDENRRPKLETEKFVECDTLLLSVGLIPENDLISNMGMEMSPITTGCVVDEFRQTSMPGIFSCGNVLHVHDLVDNVSMEGNIAGAAASDYANGTLNVNENKYNVTSENGIRYALPQKVYSGEGRVKIYFRVGSVFKDVRLNVVSNGEIIFTKKCRILTPGEMGNVLVDKSKIKGDVVLTLEK